MPADALVDPDDVPRLATVLDDLRAGLPLDGDYDVTISTYNRLSEQITFTDQRETARTFIYDTLGRLTDDCVTAVGGETDPTVQRISRTYEVRGMVTLISSYDNPTPGSGTVLNQVALTFNDFGQLTIDEQEHSGAVTGSTPSVVFSYDSSSGTTNEVRLTTLTYPNGRVITYNYGTSGSMNDSTQTADTEPAGRKGWCDREDEDAGVKPWPRNRQEPHPQADQRQVENQQHGVGDEQTGDQAPHQIRLFGEQQRTGVEAVLLEACEHHCSGCRCRQAQRQQRHQRAGG